MSDDRLSLTHANFTSLLAGLDDEALARFVADLYSASGYETAVDGTAVLLESDTEEPTQLRVHADDRSRLARLVGRTAPPDPMDAEELILGYRAARTSPNYRVTDASDLYHRLLFGVDRSTCKALCREHFDRSIEPAPEPPAGSRLDDLAAVTLLDRATILLGAAVVSVLVVGAVLAGVSNEMSDQPTESLRDPTELATPVGGALTPAPDGASETMSATTPPPEPAASRSITWNHSAHLRATPTCNRSREEVIEVFIAALRLDGRNGTTGYDTAVRFAVAETNATRQYVKRPLREPRFAPLFTFDRGRLGDAVVIRDTTAGREDAGRVVLRQEVTVVVDGGSRTFDFVMRKRLDGPRPGCWQVRSLRAPN